MKKRKISFIAFILVFLIISCKLGGISENEDALSIVISDPEDNISVRVGDEVNITSTSFSESGISRVELLVDGELVAVRTTQVLSSATHVITQYWTPDTQGSFSITVAVVGMDNQRIVSDALTVTVLEKISFQEPTQTPEPFLATPTGTVEPTSSSTVEPTPINTVGPTLQPITPTETIAPTLSFIVDLPPIEVLFPTVVPTFSIQLLPIQILPVFPNVVPNVHFVREELEIGSHKTETLTANCPSSSVITGGGFMQTAYNISFLKFSREGNGWQVVAVNNTGNNQTVVILAVCLFNSGGAVSTVGNNIYVQPNSEQEVSVNCPSGSVVTGGGWVMGDKELFIRQSSQAGNGWVVRAVNNTNSPQQVVVQANCLSDTNAVSSQVMDYVNIGAGNTEEVNAICQENQLVSGGGFFQEVRSYSNYPLTPNYTGSGYGWHGGAHNPAHHTTFSIYVYATCLTFP